MQAASCGVLIIQEIDPMEQITSDPFLLEIARTIDENNIRKRVELVHFPKKQRLIAAFRALKQAGYARAFSYDDGVRWCPTAKAVDAMGLGDCGLTEERFESALIAPFYFLFEATAAESRPDKQLVHEYRSSVEKQQLVQWWRFVGTIVGGIAKGSIRMIGPEVNGGFLFEPLDGQSGVTGEFLFSLGSSTSTTPVVTELEPPDDIKGREEMFECLIKWGESDAEMVAFA
jgi:hypothetical protein